MSSLCALYPTPSVIADGSCLARLLQRFPTPARHDGFNYLFAQTIEEITNGEMIEPTAIILEETFVDVEGVLLEPDSLAWAMAQFLINPVRPPIYGHLVNFTTLYNHAAYALYCMNYESQEDFDLDLAYMTNMLTVAKPEALTAWNDLVALATLETDMQTEIKNLITYFIS